MDLINLNALDDRVVDPRSVPERAVKHYGSHTISEVRALLRQLPEVNRHILLLFYNGNSQPEIASLIQKRQSTINYRIKSSIKMLKLLSKIPEINYLEFFSDVNQLIPKDLTRILYLVSLHKSFAATARALQCSPTMIAYYFYKALLILSEMSRHHQKLLPYTEHFYFIRSNIRVFARLHS